MKSILTILIPALLVTGCASQSKTATATTDALTFAGATALGYELSDENPAVALASGVGAYTIKKIADNSAEKKRQEEMKKAYDAGLAQGLKTQYWQNQSQQQISNQTSQTGSSTVRLPITAPERIVNGVLINASTEYIEVSQP